MDAQSQDTFSEAEMFQALSWGMPDTAARRQAKYMADDPTAIAKAFPEFKDLGPVATMYSEDTLLLLSLVSEDTRKKAERRLAQQRLRPELSEEERAEWNARRNELHKKLVAAGKLLPP
jgi:hypothetical protein